MNPRRDASRLVRSARVVVGVSVLAGLAALVATGGLARGLGFVGIVGVNAGWLLGDPNRGVQWWRALNVIAALVALGLPLALGVSWIQVGLGLLIYLQVHRAWTAIAPRDLRVALLFSLLMLLLSATLTRSAWLAPLLLVETFALPAALLLLQLWEHEYHRPARAAPVSQPRRLLPLGVMGLATGLIAAVIFVLTPRFRGGLLAMETETQSMAGFAGDVALGDLGEIKDNRALVMRAEVTDAAGRHQTGPFYFRGMALDRFDGERWQNTLRHRTRRLTRAAPSDLEPTDIRQKILLEPIGEPVLFAVPHLATVQTAQSHVFDDGLHTWRYGGAPQRLEYVAWSRPEESAPSALRQASRRVASGAFARHFTALPPDLDPRVRDLALEVTAGADTAYDKALAIERFLRRDFTYTLVPQPDTARQPLSRFLFETRTGHCEFFATALAVLLRAAEVPTVLVNGFYGGEWNPVGDYYAIRQADAHSWVEVFLGDAGWVSFDATPAGAVALGRSNLAEQVSEAMLTWWHARVLDYDLDTQLAVVASLGALMGPSSTAGFDDGAEQTLAGLRVLAIAAAVLFFAPWVLAVLLRLRRPRGSGARLRGVAALHQKARRRLVKRGWRPPAALPPVAAAKWLVEEAGEPAQPLEGLAWCLYRVRYGGEAEAAVLTEAREHVRELRRVPRRGRVAGRPD